MVAAAILSLSVTVGLMVLSLIFKVAGKLRLSLPIAYLLIASLSTFFTDWTSKNENLVFIGLYILIGLVVLSWIFSLVKTIKQKKYERAMEDDIAWQIRRAREMGIPLDTVRFDENNNLIDPRTGEPVEFGAGVEFY